MSDYYVARMSTWDSIYRYPEGDNTPELSLSDIQRYFIGNTIPPQPQGIFGKVEVTDEGLF